MKRCAFLGSTKELGSLALGTTAIGVAFGILMCRSNYTGQAEGIAYVSDTWLSLFEGCEPYVAGSGDWFILPISWFLSQAICFIAVASHNGGRKAGLPLQAEIRGITLSRWWHAQCVWATGTVMLVYAGLLLGAAAGTVAGGILLWGELPHGLVNPLYGHVPLGFFLSTAAFSSIGIACLQSALLATMTPTASLCVTLVYAASAFVTNSPIALGSLSMSCRFFGNSHDALYVVTSLAACLAVCAASAFAAGQIASRQDTL